MKLVIKICKFLFLFLLCGTLFYFGQDVPYTEQLPLYEGLRTTSSIIFGVTGAWIAIIYPGNLLDLLEGNLSDEEQKKHEKVRTLISPLVYSSVILACVLMVGILTPILKRLPFLLPHLRLVRGLSFALLGLLTIGQLWTLLLTLVPADIAQRKITSLREGQKARNRLLSRTQNSDQNPK